MLADRSGYKHMHFPDPPYPRPVDMAPPRWTHAEGVTPGDAHFEGDLQAEDLNMSEEFSR
jgi:hypothetical protein